METITAERTKREERKLTYDFIGDSNKYVYYTDTVTTIVDGKSETNVTTGCTAVNNIIATYGTFLPIKEQFNIGGYDYVIRGVRRNELYSLTTYSELSISDFYDAENIIPILVRTDNKPIIKDLNEQTISLPICVSYMIGMHSNHYNLEKVINHLSTNFYANIRVIPYDGYTDTDEFTICRVPDYNSHVADYQLMFLCELTKEQYEHYYNISLLEHSNGLWAGADYLFNDILGLRDCMI